jgi:hypothetical protein
MANWTICNLSAGCRCIEWAQTDSTKLSLHTHNLNRFGNNAYAFTTLDVQCSTQSNQLLTTTEALEATPRELGCIRLRFQEQKNGENGGKKLFVRNTKTRKSVSSRTSCKYDFATQHLPAPTLNFPYVPIAMQRAEVPSTSPLLTSKALFAPRRPTCSILTQ